MNVSYRAGLVVVGFLGFLAPAFAQQGGAAPVVVPQVAAAPAGVKDSQLTLDVVVSDKSGKPVSGLSETDFVVRDNGKVQKVLSFRAGGQVAANAEPTRIILVVDEVNTTFNKVAYERDQIKKFAQQNGGKLTHPVSLAFFTDSGTELQSVSTQDGNVLLEGFDAHETALRSVRRSAGFNGAVERFQLSLDTLNSMAARFAQQPGRKLLVWISPGWPLLAGPGVELTTKQLHQAFSSIVAASTALRLARITLYSVDPLGVEDAGSGRETYYEAFLKPVTEWQHAQLANVGLQVLARQTGGLVLNSSNDIGAEINRSFEDADAYYTITLDMAHAERPDEYHAIDVKVEGAGLSARTRSGYYAQP